MKLISVVIPLYNESELLPVLYKRLISSLLKDFKNFKWEIVFVDDGSHDDTLAVLKNIKKNDRSIKIISFSRNFGHHIAITAGIDYSSGDFVVMMDGDLQDRPEDIILLYRRLTEGNDVVYAIRKNKQFGYFKKVSSNIFNWMIKSMITEPIIINSTIFRIMTKQVVNDLKCMRESNRYIIGLIGWLGYKHSGQLVTHEKRYCGKTKYNVWNQFQLAMNAIVSFTEYPLKLASRLGFGMVTLSTFLVIYVVLKKIIYNTPLLGWTSLFIAVLFFSGIQIIFLGVMGEYLGRNYLESKNRPLYFIKYVSGLKKYA